MAGTGKPVLKVFLIFHHFYFILLGSWSPGLSTSWVWILPSCPSSSLHTRTQVWQCSWGNASWERHEAPSSSGLYKHFPKTCSHIFRCTFSRGYFLQAVNSYGYFSKRQLPKSVLAKHSAQSPFCRSARPLVNPAAALGPHCSWQHLRRPNLTFGKLPLGNFAHLGSCHLRNCHLGNRCWENAFRKILHSHIYICIRKSINI